MIEINLVINQDHFTEPTPPGTSTQGLENLSTLTPRCPSLCAVSIENLRIEAENDDKPVRQLAKFLD
ncbi:hypothetical protein BG000_006085, partial [Podila horticola]